MFSRVNQLVRHLSRPTVQSFAGTTTPSLSQPSLITSSVMAAAAGTKTQGKSLIHTAACLVIGDEVLGGKTVDTNSAYLAKFCFSLGINLRRIEVIADDESEIIEAVRRMSKNYDFVVTSGGIGPTHDDITYPSIAKAFSLPLTLHEESYNRMRKLSKPHKKQTDFSWDVPSPALEAKKRMVRLPLDLSRSLDDQVLYVKDDLWVPICVVNGNVHILPGVPSLFQIMLDSMKPRLLPRLSDPEGKGIHRILISTPLPESAVAEFLTQLAEKAEPRGVKVGSYPRWGKENNTVTLVGRDLEYMESLVPEVEEGVKGHRVVVEGEDDKSDSDPEAGKLASG